jgi:hypothetical protein
MPRFLTQYRVFIGSPGGLDDERKHFRRTLQRYSNVHAEPRGITFCPVGWEDTIGGIGRPQELINEDLSQCDYAVFILHDRWGSPTGRGSASGTEEEWTLAEKLYKENKIRNIALFFKEVDSHRLRDPGDQLRRVIEFKTEVISAKKYLFKVYVGIDEFGEELERHLAKWLRDQEGASAPFLGRQPAANSPVATIGVLQQDANVPIVPDFNYWITEANTLT